MLDRQGSYLPSMASEAGPRFLTGLLGLIRLSFRISLAFTESMTVADELWPGLSLMSRANAPDLYVKYTLYSGARCMWAFTVLFFGPRYYSPLHTIIIKEDGIGLDDGKPSLRGKI